MDTPPESRIRLTFWVGPVALGKASPNFPTYVPGLKVISMEVSARNRLRGTVQSIRRGEVMTEVAVALPGGHEVVSVITRASEDRLRLAEGQDVVVIIKSTDVLLGEVGPQSA